MDKAGVIYILTNPSFPEYVKIGYADDIDKRLQQLNRSECMFGFGRKLIHQFACMWIFCTSTYDCNDSLSAFRLLVAKMFLLNRILTMIGKVK